MYAKLELPLRRLNAA